ncbi:NAD(P)/FAD-dependent oxidoreductase [Nocardia sp. BMG51109]|uniref:flavin-containing monooxygenase n=1 Tax=Nocardia sp. BMG51109 TaxID=1056816 RepID=UPI000465EC97|nr:NAD(P)/FAD-dependent oxidoreductase [Nocardia sp. BMG51109]
MGACAQVRVAVVGAGFGGIGMGSALKRAGFDDFVILEKGADVGGVWRENTYPGCSCDVPSHLYSLSVRPYRDTGTRYPRQSGILAYLHEVVAAEGLEPHLRLRTAIREAVYDDTAGHWTLATADGGVVVADTVIFAVGQLHRPYVPDIAGRSEFTGAAFHSAAWEHSLDPRGRDVAVIGTGSSGAQLVPRIAGDARRVTVYQRTPHWILPKPRARFGAVARTALRLPGMHGLYRRALHHGADLALTPIAGRGWSARPAQHLARTHLRRQIPDPALRAALTPQYPIGAKRILFDSDFYPALREEHVELVTETIARITADGIETVDRRHRPADVIVYATGFRAPEFLVPLTVVGRAGASLHERWARGADAYLGLAVPEFPNMFLIAGPNTFLSTGSNPFMKECQIRYIIECLRWRDRTGAAAIEVAPDVAARYREWLRDRLEATVWTSGGSWYQHASGAVTNPWPASARRFDRMTRTDPSRAFVPDTLRRPGPAVAEPHRAAVGEP